MKLKNRVTVITGASPGFGMSRGFPTGFAKEGSNLVLNYYNQDLSLMNKFKDELEKFGVHVILVEGDISEKTIAKKLIDIAIEEFRKIDILINNAGISFPKVMEEISLDEWNLMLKVDLTSVFLTCKYSIPFMKMRRFGRIINISSQVAIKGSVEHCHYSAAKAGIIGFTKSLAREVGSYGINVNCIAPGPIETQLMGVVSDEWRSQKESELVIPRFGEVEEVIPTAILLASEPDGNLYTGQTFHPNSGDVMP